jgi:hypothetical protein
MTNTSEVEFVKAQLQEKYLYINHMIDLAFVIKRLIKCEVLDFSSLIRPSGGSDWQNLAVMLPYLPKSLVVAHLDQLLEGFMDTNWPGSRVLYGFLAEMDIEPLQSSFARVLRKAIDLDDSEWVWFLVQFMKSERVNLAEFFATEIEQGIDYLATKGADYADV